MKKLINILLFLLPLSIFAQTDPVEFTGIVTGKCNIAQTGSGAGYWQVSVTNYSSPRGTDCTELQVDDIVYFNDGGTSLALPITVIVSAVGNTATLRLNNTGITSIGAIPTTPAIISRGSTNFKLPPWAANTSGNDNQMVNEYMCYLIDSLLNAINVSDIDTTYVRNDSTFILDIYGNERYTGWGNYNLTDIEEKGSVTSATNLGTPESMCILGNYAYVMNFSSKRIGVFDISNPASPTLVSTTTDATNILRPFNVYAEGDSLYVINDSGGSAGAVAIYSIKNKTSPVFARKIATSGNQPTLGGFIRGRVLYATGATNAFRAWSLDNGAILSSVTNIGATSQGSKVCVFGDIAYISLVDANRVASIDISNPLSMTFLDTISTGSLTNPRAMVCDGKYLYLTGEGSSKYLNIYNASNPGTLTQISSTQFTQFTGGGEITMVLLDKILYVSGYGTNSIVVIDVTNPASPTYVKTITGTTGYAMAAGNGHIFYTDYDATKLVSISTKRHYSESLVAGNINATTIYADEVIVGNRFAYNRPIERPTVLVLADFVSDVSNGTTVETDIFSHTSVANRLSATGEKIIGDFNLQFTDNTSTATIRAYFGGTNFFDSGAITISNTGYGSVRVIVIRTGATTARAYATLTTNSNATTGYTQETDITGLTFTNTNIIKLTAQAGGGGGGSGDIVGKMGTLTYLRSSQ